MIACGFSLGSYLIGVVAAGVMITVLQLTPLGRRKR